MTYQLADWTIKSMKPMHYVLRASHNVISHPANPYSWSLLGKFHGALLESAARVTREYPKRGFNFASVNINGKSHSIRQRSVLNKPFCDLLHFERQGAAPASKVLFVAAMSGHHATLSREALAEFLPDHEVYVTDWRDARQVPLDQGRFGLEDYAAYLLEFLEVLGPDTHVVGICQAAVPALMVTALMAMDDHPARPRSLSLLAGPMDITAAPSAMRRACEKFDLSLMRKLLIHRVPMGYPGVGRKVYPGVQQVAGFMAGNYKAHLQSNMRFLMDVTLQREVEAQKHREFYDEYYAVMDSTGEFWVETMERVFLDQHLPKGIMQFRGRTIDCTAIRDIPLLTLEGEKDEMVVPGVTQAAQNICSSLPAHLRAHHVQADV
ncbi:MAG: polyhydroxyalkanoate depolymerase, partial [Lysobacterales bacterium]